ncbi:hypothetical protein NJC38_24475 [Pseudomonas sp. 21LCFQ010]|uniref:hypothetical protein n=1 Tax=Pseudomonas sp. 21LCFQ010 TaxID=2957506 RepID=UPI002098337B|nr:hypothetical protein [Pseudomonas sp. 21LCFQ010]MCO8165299.1 hypothetical protein [Pseudomonas sp. 21LCFQ010]
MNEFNQHLHQLPDFLQQDLAAHVGNTAGLAASQIVARYRSSAQHLVTSRYAGLLPQDINDARLYLSHMPYDKENIENYLKFRQQGFVGIGFSAEVHNAHFILESNRFLMDFVHRTAAVEVRLAEQERLTAQRQAEEAARQHAQRMAEEAARRLAQQQAEEAARELVRRQIEEAKQRAQHEVEEAARKLAQQKAEQETLRATTMPIIPASSIELIFGPQATADVTTAMATLKSSIDQAITVFSETIRPHAAHLQDPNFQNLLELSGAERH